MTASDHEAHGRCESCGFPAHRYPFGWQHVGSGLFSCPTLRPAATCCGAHGSPCPDGGSCHHGCAAGECFRVEHAGPLSNVLPGDRWPSR